MLLLKAIITSPERFRGPLGNHFGAHMGESKSGGKGITRNPVEVLLQRPCQDCFIQLKTMWRDILPRAEQHFGAVGLLTPSPPCWKQAAELSVWIIGDGSTKIILVLVKLTFVL